MFDNPRLDLQSGLSLDSTRRETPTFEDFCEDREKVEREFRERLSKLPRWRRRLIETAISGNW